MVAYTAEQKVEAIELAGEVGIREAARRLGIPSGTIGCWRSRAPGVVAATAEARQASTAAANAGWIERRAKLGQRAGEVAAQALEEIPKRIEAGDELAAQRLASTMAALVDKAQLLTGEATERVEQLGGGSAVEAAKALLDDVRERHLKAVS